MKNFCFAIFAAGVLAGCASGPQGLRVNPVGPEPAAVSPAQGDGILQVFSARRYVPANVEMANYVNRTGISPEDNYEQKQDLLHTSARGNYSIYTTDGKFLKRIANAKGMNGAEPTRVELSPGRYLVEADTEELDTFRHPVLVPVEIKAGLTTAVRLDGGWPAALSAKTSDVVRLPNGEIIGWAANAAE